MLKNYIQNKQLNEQVQNFYTPSGIHVYFKEQLLNDWVDVEEVVLKLESLMPQYFFNEMDMIIVGHFGEFEKRHINAFYKDSALYVSNFQTNNEDLLDDLVHEMAHAIEEAYGYEIYADSEIKDEFLNKRNNLYHILWKMDFKAPKSLFLDTEYDKEFDDFLLKDIGYDKLSAIMQGMFINPYAATSLREYFATAFTEFYLHTDEHRFLKTISPQAYKKIILINRLDKD